MIFLNWLAHALGADFGVRYGHWVIYNVESGSGSDVSELAMVGAIGGLLRRSNCHKHHCWRFGHYPLTDLETGMTWKLCHKHHPDHPGRKKITAEYLAAVHARIHRTEQRDTPERLCWRG